MLKPWWMYRGAEQRKLMRLTRIIEPLSNRELDFVVAFAALVKNKRVVARTRNVV